MKSVTLDASIRKGPQYRAVEQALIARMAGGTLCEGELLPSASELAELLGASASTVRNSLQTLAANGLVQRVPGRGTTVAHGVTDLLRARGVTSAGTAFALFVPDIRIPNFAGLARCVEQAGHEHGMTFSVLSSDDPQRFGESLERCIEQPVRGLIIVPPFKSGVPLRILGRLEDAGIPVVNFWRPLGSSRWPLLRGSPFSGSNPALDHLVSCGYQRIGIVALYPRPGADITDQLCQYEHSYRVQGLDFDAGQAMTLSRDLDFWIHPYDLAARRDLAARILAWLEERPELDALLCSSPDVAVLVIEALDRLGRGIPEPVGVVTVGNMGAYALDGSRTITAFDGDLAGGARRACELLRAMAEGQTFPPQHVEYIAYRFLQGTTTRRCEPDSRSKA